MKFAAVKSFFKPVTSAELEQLARKHAGSRGEQAISLEEVGLDSAARAAVARTKRRAAAPVRRANVGR